MDATHDKQQFIHDEWAVIGIAGSLTMLIGWADSSAKSAPNLSKNGLATNQIMIRKASASCNHICMDATIDKQKFIHDEWAVIVIAGSLWPLWVGWQ